MSEIDAAITNTRESKLQRSKAIMERLEFDYARLCKNCTWNKKGICTEPLVSRMKIVEGDISRVRYNVDIARRDESLCGKDGDLYAPKSWRQLYQRRIYWSLGIAAYMSALFAVCAIWGGPAFVIAILITSFGFFAIALS